MNEKDIKAINEVLEKLIPKQEYHVDYYLKYNVILNDNNNLNRRSNNVINRR